MKTKRKTIKQITKELRDYTSNELRLIPAYLDKNKDILIVEERVVLNEIVLNLITPKFISDRVIDISVKRFNMIIDNIAELTSDRNKLLELAVDYQVILEYIDEWAKGVEAFEAGQNIIKFKKKLYGK